MIARLCLWVQIGVPFLGPGLSAGAGLFYIVDEFNSLLSHDMNTDASPLSYSHNQDIGQIWKITHAGPPLHARYVTPSDPLCLALSCSGSLTRTWLPPHAASHTIPIALTDSQIVPLAALSPSLCYGCSKGPTGFSSRQLTRACCLRSSTMGN